MPIAVSVATSTFHLTVVPANIATSIPYRQYCFAYDSRGLLEAFSGNTSGELSRHELGNMLASLGQTGKSVDVDDFMKRAGGDMDSNINLDSFVETLSSSGTLEMEALSLDQLAECLNHHDHLKKESLSTGC